MAKLQSPNINLGTSVNSLGMSSITYQSPYISGVTNVSVNMQHDGITIELSMRVDKAPQTIDDIPLIMANDYLKKRNIDMTLEEIINKFLPEYTL